MNQILPNRRKHFRDSFSNLYSNNLGGTNEYATVPDNSAFSFGDGAGNDSPFSVSIFMKRTGAGNEILVAKFGSVFAYEWYLFCVGTTFWFGLWSPTGAPYIIRTAPLSDIGSWVHVCTTYDGSKATTGMKIYKNAVQIDNGNVTSGVYNGMSNTNSVLSIGADGAATGCFTGKLAHPIIINKELSGAEVTEIYNLKMGDARTLSFAANVISPFYFENGQASFPTWTDYKNGYNATMQNQEDTDIDTDVPT